MKNYLLFLVIFLPGCSLFNLGGTTVARSDYIPPYLISQKSPHCVLHSYRDMSRCLLRNQQIIEQQNYNNKKISEIINKKEN